mgnify:CR=1 FL=1
MYLSKSADNSQILLNGDIEGIMKQWKTQRSQNQRQLNA